MIAPVLIQQLPTIPLLISAMQGVNVDRVMTEWFNIFCNVHEGNAIQSNMVFVQYRWVHSYHVLLRIYSARVNCIVGMLFKCSILVVSNHQNSIWTTFPQCSYWCWIRSQQDMVGMYLPIFDKHHITLNCISFMYVTKNMKPLCLNHVNIHTLYCRNYQWYSW